MAKEITQYDEWNSIKKRLSTIDKPNGFYFNEGDIWWVSLGINIGTESYGKGSSFRRPILIIKKISSDACIAIPLTTRAKSGSWFIDINFENEVRYALLYQIRMIHTRRFQRKIGHIPLRELVLVRKKLKTLLEL